MVEGLEEYLAEWQMKRIEEGNLSAEELKKVLSFRPRIEKLVSKDVKLRTFITNDDERDEMVSHVYEMTYEVIKKGIDTVVLIDDSIVRGTTLEKSILKMIDRLGPKKVIIVSSAPQIRYPDCYGIDMSKMREFVAFRAMLNLLHKNGIDYMKQEVYAQSMGALQVGNAYEQNFVKQLYDKFTDDEISQEIAKIVTPETMKAEVAMVYQTVENLHKACPKHLGDWYFTGNYPTRGGNRVVNRAFVNFMEGKLVRAY